MQNEYFDNLKEEICINGYLTPEIGNFLEKLLIIPDSDVEKYIENWLIINSKDPNNPLQIYFIVYKFLCDFKFSTDVTNTIVANIVCFLSNSYKQNLSMNDYDIDTRSICWKILSMKISNIDKNLQQIVLDFDLGNEDIIIKDIALHTKLELSL